MPSVFASALIDDVRYRRDTGPLCSLPIGSSRQYLLPASDCKTSCESCQAVRQSACGVDWSMQRLCIGGCRGRLHRLIFGVLGIVFVCVLFSKELTSYASGLSSAVARRISDVGWQPGFLPKGVDNNAASPGSPSSQNSFALNIFGEPLQPCFVDRSGARRACEFHGSDGRAHLMCVLGPSRPEPLPLCLGVASFGEYLGSSPPAWGSLGAKCAAVPEQALDSDFAYVHVVAGDYAPVAAHLCSACAEAAKQSATQSSAGRSASVGAADRSSGRPYLKERCRALGVLPQRVELGSMALPTKSPPQ